MQVRDFLIDPAQFAAARPLAFVDLAMAESDWEDFALPPYPVIGLGDPAHPLAEKLDAIVEPPVSAELLMTRIVRSPHAASVLVQLLRVIEDMQAAPALVLESLAYGALQAGEEHAAWLEGRASVVAGERAARPLIVERRAECLEVRLNRPDVYNAIDAVTRDALREAFTIAALDPDIERVILSGAGRAFCLGADLSEFGTTRDPAEAHRIRMQTLPAYAIIRCADRFEAQVQGGCAGSGLEIMSFASMIAAHPDSWFQLPELAMGILPGAGGCVSVSRRIGRQRAALMMLSGKRISSGTALEWGLIDTIVDDFAADNCGADRRLGEL